LIFSSTLFSGRAARALINERANQATCNDPLRAREVKPGLSRSFPPLLWISRRAKIFFDFFFDAAARALSSGGRMNFAPRMKKVCERGAKAGHAFSTIAFSCRRCGSWSILRLTSELFVASAAQPRKFTEEMPSQRRIS
jgi:hypothetical protein